MQSILPYTTKHVKQNFCSFHRFSLDRESYATAYGPVNWQYKHAKAEVFQRIIISTLNAKIFHLKRFAVCGKNVANSM